MARIRTRHDAEGNRTRRTKTATGAATESGGTKTRRHRTQASSSQDADTLLATDRRTYWMTSKVVCYLPRRQRGARLCRPTAVVLSEDQDADTLLSKDWRHLEARVGWAVARRLIIGRQGQCVCADGGACGSEASRMMMGRLGGMRSALQRKIQLRIQRGAGGAIT